MNIVSNFTPCPFQVQCCSYVISSSQKLQTKLCLHLSCSLAYQMDLIAKLSPKVVSWNFISGNVYLQYLYYRSWFCWAMWQAPGEFLHIAWHCYCCSCHWVCVVNRCVLLVLDVLFACAYANYSGIQTVFCRVLGFHRQLSGGSASTFPL